MIKKGDRVLTKQVLLEELLRLASFWISVYHKHLYIDEINFWGLLKESETQTVSYNTAYVLYLNLLPQTAHLQHSLLILPAHQTQLDSVFSNKQNKDLRNDQ